MAVQGRARSERQIGSFWASFVTALASNADTNARPRSLKALHKEVLDHYVCSKMPTAPNLSKWLLLRFWVVTHVSISSAS